MKRGVRAAGSIAVLGVLLVVSGCLSFTSPGGSAGLSAINALAYTDNEFNVHLARGINDRAIGIEYVETGYSYYDPANPDIVFIANTYSGANTVQHVADYATVLAYLGYLRANQGNAAVAEDAEAHAVETLDLAIERYVVGAAAQTYDDARGFQSRLVNGSATGREGTLFTIE